MGTCTGYMYVQKTCLRSFWSLNTVHPTLFNYYHGLKTSRCHWKKKQTLHRSAVLLRKKKQAPAALLVWSCRCKPVRAVGSETLKSSALLWTSTLLVKRYCRSISWRNIWIRDTSGSSLNKFTWVFQIFRTALDRNGKNRFKRYFQKKKHF